jgi:hypothetical protein
MARSKRTQKPRRGPQERVCCVCGAELPATGYVPTERRADGWAWWCTEHADERSEV